MPFVGVHAIRVKEPRGFERFRRKRLARGVVAIIGFRNSGRGSTVQALRFDAKLFTPAQARTWAKDHDFAILKFEGAVKEEATLMNPSWILEAIRQDNRRPEARGATLSLDERMTLVSTAVRVRFGSKEKPWATWPIAVYDDRVVVRQEDKSLFQVSLEWMADNTVELKGDRVKVEQRFVPVSQISEQRLFVTDGEVLRLYGEILGPVLEETTGGGAGTLTGAEWDVVIIQEGLSQNRYRYSRTVLAAALPLYEAARTFLDHKLDPGPFGRSAADLVGFLRDVQPVIISGSAEAKGRFALTARACITRKPLREELLEAWRLGNPNLLGLSHDVRAESAAVVLEDGPAYDVRAIKHVESVDWVVNPSAGGRVMRLVASDGQPPHLEEDARMLERLIAQLKAAGVTVPENCDETTATRLLTEALAARAAAPPPVVAPVVATGSPPAGTPAAAPATVVAAVVPAPVVAAAAIPATGVVTEARTAPPGSVILTAEDHGSLVRRLESTERAITDGARSYAGMMLERSLLECALPDVFKKRLRKRFTEEIGTNRFPTETDVAEAIRAYVDDVAAMREANIIMPHVGVAREVMVEDRTQRVQERFADFFDPTKPLQSFRQLYIDITGDTKVNGKMTEEVHRRLSEVHIGRVGEALQVSSFDQILGDSITRRMLKEYADSTLANWRGTIGEVTPLNDFRTVRRMRFGGYGNLPTVAEGGTYTALTSPTDEEATYAPAKRGGTESITIEMIKNDDVGAIRRIPSKLSRAAAHTLHEFVWDLLNNNGVIYDSVALAAAGHNNIVTTAMSSANIATLRLNIKQQTDLNNAKRLGLMARYLILPSELEEVGFQLTTSDLVLGSGNNDPNFIKKLNLTMIVVEYWTDVNNYWVAGSVDQSPMIEVGFLDGQESPELFVQDLPNVGSMFSNDQLTWKIRHIYGAAIMDFRPFAGGIVA